MTLLASNLDTGKPFVPGTTGWTAADLDDPAIEREWFAGRYEIIHGVLTTMAPAFFFGGAAIQSLVHIIQKHFDEHGTPSRFASEVDIVIDAIRVARADMICMTQEQRRLQARAARAAGRTDARRSRILIPPMLVIESISPGHELHDRETKAEWYAEFGVDHYWLLDGLAKSLECRVRRGMEYVVDVVGSEADEICPAAFPNLVIPLQKIWDDE